MWRSSVSRKRSEASLRPPTNTNLSTDSIDKSTPPTTRGTPPSRTTLSEYFRSRPFRLSSKDVSETQAPHQEDPVRLLNRDLCQAATIYPDVQLDVLRELLFRFDGESRLQVCVEQLFRYKSEWARGRVLNPPRDTDDDIPSDELFRNSDYIKACKRTLYSEFKSLNKSAIDAVLAEINNSYTKARPTLQDISAKTWRATLTSFFRKKRANEEPPIFLCAKSKSGAQLLLSTGNTELDAELHEVFLAHSHRDQIIKQKQDDHRLASKLNHEEAEEAGALFECQCCFDDVPFEQITACAAAGHVLCIDCVRRTLNEALFGQSWSKSVDVSIGSLICFAPLSSGQCGSHVHQQSVRSAIVSATSGQETWLKFEQRMMTENLGKAGLTLQNCPFCPYAEYRETQTLQSVDKLRWHLRPDRLAAVLTIILFVTFSQSLALGLLIMSLGVLAMFMFLPPSFFRQSLININESRRTHKFKCRSPSCSLTSCTVCHKQWHDPHTCHEPLVQSLRNTVEAARTAALKRVCPRCGMGFVKSSGCNKLVCVCGYAMCYLCRKNIGKVTGAPTGMLAAGAALNFANGNQVPDADADDPAIAAAGEGYRHFCPHFRPVLGQKCTECDKCDLYKNEDEDALVRQAGQLAEQEWRAKHEQDMSARAGSGKADIASLDKALAGIEDDDYNYMWYLVKRFERIMWKTILDIRRGRFNRQDMVDWIVDRIVIVEDGRR